MPMEFIAINTRERNSNPIKRASIEDIYSTYPDADNLLIFSKGTSNYVNTENGLLFYENKLKKQFIVQDKYALVDCKPEGNGPKYIFCFHEYSTCTIRRFSIPENHTRYCSFSTQLDLAIKEFIFACQFNSWNEYQEYHDIRRERNELVNSVDALARVNNQLVCDIIELENENVLLRKILRNSNEE
jgi:hypothetical protein